MSIVLIDKPLANFVATRLGFAKPFFNNYTAFFDAVSIHIFWILAGALVLGLAFLFSNRTKKLGFVLLTIICAHLVASALTNIMKSEFKRARPEIYLGTKGQSNDFYNNNTRDYSFPSSHTSFYISLFLPVALVFRKYAVLILLLPGIIILGRIVLNEHYLSDVLCSILLVYNLCYIIYSLLCQADRARAGFVNNKIKHTITST